MGLFVREVSGEEYVYILAGKKQFFLGRKGDLANYSQESLTKAAAEFNKTIDKQMKKYAENILECVKYMEKKDASVHLSKRRSKMCADVLKIK